MKRSLIAVFFHRDVSYVIPDGPNILEKVGYATQMGATKYTHLTLNMANRHNMYDYRLVFGCFLKLHFIR